MTKRTLMIVISSSVLAVAILVTVVVVLRQRSSGGETLIPIVRSTTTVSPSASVPSLKDLTPVELKERQAVTDTIKAMPKDLRSTLTPEEQKARDLKNQQLQ